MVPNFSQIVSVDSCMVLGMLINKLTLFHIHWQYLKTNIRKIMHIVQDGSRTSIWRKWSAQWVGNLNCKLEIICRIYILWFHHNKVNPSLCWVCLFISSIIMLASNRSLQEICCSRGRVSSSLLSQSWLVYSLIDFYLLRIFSTWGRQTYCVWFI